MTATYRLEFLHLGSQRTTVIEVTTKDLFQDLVLATVDHLAKTMSGQ